MDSTIPMAGKRKRITLPTSAKPFLREFRGISAWAWGFLVLSWFKKAPAFYAMQLFTIFRQHATSRLVGVPSAVIQWSNEPMSSFAKNRQLVLKLVMSLGRSTIATSDVAIQTIAKGRFSVAQVKTCQASQDMSRPNDVFGQAMSCGPIWCPKVSIEWLKASKIKSNIFAQLASNPQLSISGSKMPGLMRGSRFGCLTMRRERSHAMVLFEGRSVSIKVNGSELCWKSVHWSWTVLVGG